MTKIRQSSIIQTDTCSVTGRNYKKGSKPPEEPRKDLLDTAARLFSGKGYKSVSVRDILAEIIVKDISGYEARFGNSGEDTVSDISYKIYDLLQMISKLIKPYSVFMLQGVSEGKIVNRLGITVENAEATAAFALYGILGMIYNDRFTVTKLGTDAKDMEDVIKQSFY